MTHIDLFSGIGGFALAASWAGFETIAFCEIDPFCQKVLTRRFNGQVVTDADRQGQQESEHISNAPDSAEIKTGVDDRPERHDRTVTDSNERIFGKVSRKGERELRPESVIPIYPDIRKFDGTKYRGATLLTGGFPCQPFSCAGKRKGKEDVRHLWPQMFRIIKEARPRWVIGENVAGIVKMELNQVLSDLESVGYECQPIIIPACAVNAPHRRDRVWIIAYNIGEQKHAATESGLHPEFGEPGFNATDPAGLGRDRKFREGEGIQRTDLPRREVGTSDKPERDVTNPDGYGLSDGLRRNRSGRQAERTSTGRPVEGCDTWQENWYEVATRLCTLDDGLPGGLVRPKGWRVNALKAAGNAIVPQVAYEILKGIAEIEKGGTKCEV